MESQIIPHASKWYLLNGFDATPDNGCIYVSTFSIVYIPGIIKKTEKPKIKLFHQQYFIKGIACDPDWSETQYFAALTHDNSIIIYDKNCNDPIAGHRGHCGNDSGMDDKSRPTSSKSANDVNQHQGVLCFTTNKRVYSIHNDVFINYCVRSNTFVADKTPFCSKKNIPTTMKASPYDPDTIALGTRTGLILLCSIKSKFLLSTFRGHDSEITSLDWMMVRIPKPQQKPAKHYTPKEPKNLKPLHDDTTDLFDIYSYDDLENEFGAAMDTNLNDTTFLDCSYTTKEVVTENENFNFVEACQTLKEEMLAKPTTSSFDGADESFNRPTADEIKDAYNLDCDRSNRTIDDSNRSVSSREDISSDEMADELKFQPPATMVSDENARDFIMVETFETVPQDVAEERIILVSAARENSIWFWDVDNKNGLDKIVMNTPRHHATNWQKLAINVSWINENTLISTNPNGDICEWKLNFPKIGQIKVKLSDKRFVENSIYALTTNKTNRDSDSCPLIWSLSSNRNGYCTRLTDTESVFVFGSTGTPINFIAECPMDLNKLAIACCDKRICIMNVSNLTPNSIPLISLGNKIQSKVLSLAWHPTKESILAYSTQEGQVGLYDTTKPSNVPIRIKPFTGVNVYTLSWGEICTDGKKNLYALFAADKCGKFVYIPESGEGKYQPIPLKVVNKVTEVACYNNFMAVGTTNGQFVIMNLKNNFEVLYSEENLTKKYISSINWNPINNNLLAIASDDGSINIMDMKKPQEKRKLDGHKLGVAFVKWSNNSLNKLVSASFDLTVRVWDVNTLTAISINIFNDFMFSAIFSPLDDNFIICAGNRDPLTIYDYRATTFAETDIRESKKRMTKTAYKMYEGVTKWGTPLETAKPMISTRKEYRQNKLDELSNKLESISVDENEGDSVAATKSAGQTVNTTLCYLTNAEINREPLKAIKHLLNAEQEFGDGDRDRNVCHQKLFGGRREINELLQLELKNLKSSMSNTIGNILLPQITGDLKSEILDKIEKKQLTEQHVAVSPHVSHEFWRATCKAYGYQCIEKGHTLNAIQYLLATHELNDAIEALCKGHYYREAWIIAKLHKEVDDPGLAGIFDKWTTHVNFCGNYLGLALLNICNGNFKSALESMNKIKNPTEEIENVMELLKRKL